MAGRDGACRPGSSVGLALSSERFPSPSQRSKSHLISIPAQLWEQLSPVHVLLPSPLPPALSLPFRVAAVRSNGKCATWLWGEVAHADDAGTDWTGQMVVLWLARSCPLGYVCVF